MAARCARSTARGAGARCCWGDVHCIVRFCQPGNVPNIRILLDPEFLRCVFENLELKLIAIN